MKIHIIFEFKDGAWGGGNQFLKALRGELIRLGRYAENPREADVFLFNSFQDINLSFRLKRQYPDKLFVHRLDGPVSLCRGSRFTLIDKVIYKINNLIADGTIFQSDFSLKSNRWLGMKDEDFQATIFNAPDNSIFHPKDDESSSLSGRKIKLISTSWSPNFMKGFYEYKYLDNNLDFNRFEYTFVGNAPTNFRNIKVIKPLDSKSLAQKLRQSDIYITASHKDPCSNSLIEALSSGLPAVALDDGGHPELIAGGGVVFRGLWDIISKIEKVADNYQFYKNNLPVFDIKSVAEKYYDFCEKIYLAKQSGQYHPKKITSLKSLILNLYLLFARYI